ncbi:MAG: glycerol-3-phosphate 1-O-acyltransferase PlsY [Armatimonadetes bacterium]|nr:glycerol-3-phosphate 1-O-acyltransferase PlsY [Armatimonadota bacterium]
MTAAAVLAAAYLIGSLPTGLALVRMLAGTDLRRQGSGNIGAANVYRVAGPGLAALVLAADMLKGTSAVLLARAADLGAGWSVAAGLIAIAGHNWSVFLRFGGGKGIATSFGVLLAISPVAAAVAAGVWVAAVAVTRYASVGSLLAVASVPLVVWGRGEPRAHLVFGLAALLLAVYRHWANIRRLLAGTELRVFDTRGPVTRR